MATHQKLRLAILDDYEGIAPGKFSHLSAQIETTSFPDTLDVNVPEQRDVLVDRLRPFAIISTMRERTAFPADVIDALPNLKLLLTTGMKNAAIDMAACTRRGIVVAGARGVGKESQGKSPTSLDSTLEHTWALILAIARHVPRDDLGVKSGAWQQSFAMGLKGKTLGILGLGKLGADTARVGVLAFGVRVLAWSNSLTQEIADEKATAIGMQPGSFKVAASKEELLQAADILSIHYVLSERSRNILGAKELALLKPTAVLVNTSRGPLVDENALLSTLKQGNIRGAALDVYNKEPLPLDSEWRTTRWGQNGSSEVILSPHMGYVEEGAMHRWYEDTAQNVEVWLGGNVPATKLN